MSFVARIGRHKKVVLFATLKSSKKTTLFQGQIAVDRLAHFRYNSGLVSKKGAAMQFTLITKQGKIMQFYVRGVAELYQALNGGVVFSQQILEQEDTKTVDQKTV